MARLVECVPNFSEGRDRSKVDLLCEALTSVGGVTLLDREMDPDHHRSVITVVGPPDEVAEAAFRAARLAAEIIDLTHHRGQHPRMGATDVVPFVPLEGTSMEDCVALARRLGQRIGEDLGIPVYLYERAATRPDREDLATVRRGEFEGLSDLIGKDPGRDPDFGPRRIHPTAGATAVGARTFLIAYNVNLQTARIEVAERIARAVRARTGGLKAVKAKGFYLADRGMAQVSMNLVNFRESPVHRAFLLVREEAERHGVAVLESEIVGLVPTEALVDAAAHLLRLSETFSTLQVLETRLARARAEPSATIAPWLDRVAAPTPTPGGGSVAALSGAAGAALVSMVAGMTAARKQFLAVAPAMIETRQEAERLRRELTDLAEEDARAFEALMAAGKLPSEPEARAVHKQLAVREATLRAIEVPRQVMARALRVAELGLQVARHGNPSMVTDAGVAGACARAALRAAQLNVRINLPGLGDAPERAAIESHTRDLWERGKAMVDEVEQVVESRLAPPTETGPGSP